MSAHLCRCRTWPAAPQLCRPPRSPRTRAPRACLSTGECGGREQPLSSPEQVSYKFYSPRTAPCIECTSCSALRVTCTQPWLRVRAGGRPSTDFCSYLQLHQGRPSCPSPSLYPPAGLTTVSFLLACCSSTKGAIIAFTRSLSQQLAPKVGIAVVGQKLTSR